ncbi:transketolase [Candidatus Shapirobacteria bacterium CG_4_10_14_3_um_filter_35_13]|uniref:Transketolase n=1 Tax=Candidatus Shapirobacteria bacterium CG_4_10_14_3_um_filter_35_13 TaxID=1974873 RepID=A0A2M7LIY8_9BACT|nr:MAG: transketolase [Candidatus Shapirobacteria bacterium CG_4_10_14_3_um_filter_35_13]
MKLWGQPVHPLTSIARELRLTVFEMINSAKSGHLGGSFSVLDIMTVLYFTNIFNFDRDHFILSPGHLSATLYAILGKIGKIPESSLPTFSQIDSILESHTNSQVPRVEFSSGALGQGLSFASGLALGDKGHHTICLTTDGEHDEGQIWEAIMFANKYHLGNLINIIDCNHMQIGGSTDEIMPLDELAAKYIRFGWTVQTIDGHNFYQLEKALKTAKNSTIYPACIIAKTTMGKGISFMENDYHYHDVKKLSPEIYQKAISELSK